MEKVNKNLSFEIIKSEATPHGNWSSAKDFFPIFDINQKESQIKMTIFSTSGHQKKASISTDAPEIKISDDKTQALVIAKVSCKNWVNWQGSGDKIAVFAIFVGDSDHIYIHRASATKGWLNLNPNNIRKRLVKLGIGATQGVLQQGDFLLKPANGSSFPDDKFLHEKMGSGHHNFELPQLFFDGQFWIKEEVRLIHKAIDGIQHPIIIVPPGKYIVGTTASQLRHANKRD